MEYLITKHVLSRTVGYVTDLYMRDYVHKEMSDFTSNEDCILKTPDSSVCSWRQGRTQGEGWG